ncbi:MAG: hypothetical protein CSA95_08725 [Bacteroidetes bacterium]|nr:MAG: hypothetical protein CSA95_08725 [Bacteroidota bacterium]
MTFVAQRVISALLNIIAFTPVNAPISAFASLEFERSIEPLLKTLALWTDTIYIILKTITQTLKKQGLAPLSSKKEIMDRKTGRAKVTGISSSFLHLTDKLKIIKPFITFTCLFGAP